MPQLQTSAKTRRTPAVAELALLGRHALKRLLVRSDLSPTWRHRAQRRLEGLERERQRLARMLAHERPLWRSGYREVAGIDEVGVGPLAGPVVAAAVILPPNPVDAGLALWPRLDDSKKLSRPVRESLDQAIRQHALGWGIGVVEVAEIDELGIGPASRLAMARALTSLPLTPRYLLVDARQVDGFVGPQKALVGGDGLSLSIAAASVVAKVSRDRMMIALDQAHPSYGFAAHAGYGTAAHLEALARYGPVPAHRRSFAPVKRCL